MTAAYRTAWMITRYTKDDPEDWEFLQEGRVGDTRLFVTPHRRHAEARIAEMRRVHGAENVYTLVEVGA